MSYKQPAQAGQVLSDEEIDSVYIACRIGGVQDFARAIEQSVLAKRVPIDFDAPGPQVTVAEDGREPSLRSVLIHYYASHGFNKASAEWAANDYIRLYGIVGEKGGA